MEVLAEHSTGAGFFHQWEGGEVKP